MSKHYKRGKINNYSLVSPNYLWCSAPLVKQRTAVTKKLRSGSYFVKIVIIRGIGYRVFSSTNDAVFAINLKAPFVEKLRPYYAHDICVGVHEVSQSVNLDFPYSRYLNVRAGHTRDLYLPVGPVSRILTFKKDRKLVVAGSDPATAANIIKQVWLYRTPSVYTGRGVRIKHSKPIRKAGKKDKQKGKVF